LPGVSFIEAPQLTGGRLPRSTMEENHD